MSKYKCPKCNRGFNRNEHLSRHINKKKSCSKNIPNIPDIPDIPDIPNNELKQIINNENVNNHDNLIDNLIDNEEDLERWVF